MSKQDDLLFQLQDELRLRLTSNPELKAIFRKIQSGTATLDDTFRYSQISSELLGNFLSEKVSELSPSDREYVCCELLKSRHFDINQRVAEVQRLTDKKNRLNLNPQKATFPTERVQQIARSLTDPTVPIETIQRRADSSVANVGLSFHDDCIQENVKFRSNAGLKCRIVRTADGKCCKWCTSMAGRWVYGEEPPDVYRRHDNCTCSVTFENGRERQNVWNKKTWEVKEGFQPTVLSREQAEQIQDISYMSNSFRPVYSNKNTNFQIENILINTKKVENSHFNLFTDIEETRKSKAVRLAEKNLRAIQKLLPNDFEMPPVAVINFDNYKINSNAIGGFHSKTGVMYINNKYDSPEKILEFVNKNEGFFANKTQYAPFLHELGHKYYEDCVNSLAISKQIEYNKSKSIINHKIYNFINDNNLEDKIDHILSTYAQIGYVNSNYTELIAESFSVKENNSLANSLILLIRGNIK